MGSDAPSNANTSGLEVVAWTGSGSLSRIKGKDFRFQGYIYGTEDEAHPIALVTAASAQVRIAELERALEKTASDFQEAAEAHASEKARADRLADIVKLLDECIWFNPDTQNFEVNHDGSVEKARTALQQETQP